MLACTKFSKPVYLLHYLSDEAEIYADAKPDHLLCCSQKALSLMPLLICKVFLNIDWHIYVTFLNFCNQHATKLGVLKYARFISSLIKIFNMISCHQIS